MNPSRYRNLIQIEIVTGIEETPGGDKYSWGPDPRFPSGLWAAVSEVGSYVSSGQDKQDGEIEYVFKFRGRLDFPLGKTRFVYRGQKYAPRKPRYIPARLDETQVPVLVFGNEQD